MSLRLEALAGISFEGGAVYVAPLGIATVGRWRVQCPPRDGLPFAEWAASPWVTVYGDTIESSQAALNAFWREGEASFSWTSFLSRLVVPAGWVLVGGSYSGGTWRAILSDDPAAVPWAPASLSLGGAPGGSGPGGGADVTVTAEPASCRGDVGLLVTGGYVPPYTLGLVTWEGEWNGVPAFDYVEMPEHRNDTRREQVHALATSSALRVVVLPDPETGAAPALVWLARCSRARVVYDSDPAFMTGAGEGGPGVERLRNTRRLGARGLAGLAETRGTKRRPDGAQALAALDDLTIIGGES